MTWDLYQSKLRAMGGIVEEFVAGNVKQSPSVQFRVDPAGRLEAISTHDQVLGGQNGQIFLGCRFPADEAYRLDIQARGMRGGTGAGRQRRAGPLRHRFHFGQRGRCLASPRDRDQSEEGRHDASVSDAAVPDRRPTTIRQRVSS